MPLAHSRFTRNRMDYLSSAYNCFSEFLLHNLCQSRYSASHPLETQPESTSFYPALAKPSFSFRHYIKMPNQECSLTNLPYPNWCRRRESNPCPKHIITFTFFTQQIDFTDVPNNQTLVSFIGYAERLSDTYLGCKDYTRLHHLFLVSNKKPSFYCRPTN